MVYLDQLFNISLSVPGLQSAAPYSLSRNKSEGHIIRGTGVQENEAAEDEAGYLSDICDYNLQNDPPAAEDKEAGVVHGKLFIPMSSDTEASPLIRVHNSELAKSTVSPLKPPLEPPHSDKRIKRTDTASNHVALDSHFNPFDTLEILKSEFEKSAINNPAFLPKSRSCSVEPAILPKFSSIKPGFLRKSLYIKPAFLPKSGSIESAFLTKSTSSFAEPWFLHKSVSCSIEPSFLPNSIPNSVESGYFNSNTFQLGEDEEVVGCEFDYDESSVQTGILQIAKPGKKVKHSDEEDSQLSRQSSVEDNKVIS